MAGARLGLWPTDGLPALLDGALDDFTHADLTGLNLTRERRTRRACAGQRRAHGGHRKPTPTPSSPDQIESRRTSAAARRRGSATARTSFAQRAQVPLIGAAPAPTPGAADLPAPRRSSGRWGEEVGPGCPGCQPVWAARMLDGGDLLGRPTARPVTRPLARTVARPPAPTSSGRPSRWVRGSAGDRATVPAPPLARACT
jgi:hypothetical protein